MKTNYLLSNQFKRIGWILFIPSAILGLLFVIFQYDPKILDIKVFAILQTATGPWETGKGFCVFTKTNASDEIIGILLIISSFFIAFSKEKNEDEFISKIRLESLLWATYLNYAILIVAMLFIYGMAFFWVLVFNMITILLFFIVRFNWILKKSRNLVINEKQY